MSFPRRGTGNNNGRGNGRDTGIFRSSQKNIGATPIYQSSYTPTAISTPSGSSIAGYTQYWPPTDSYQKFGISESDMSRKYNSPYRSHLSNTQEIQQTRATQSVSANPRKPVNYSEYQTPKNIGRLSETSTKADYSEYRTHENTGRRSELSTRDDRSEYDKEREERTQYDRNPHQQRNQHGHNRPQPPKRTTG